MTNPVAGRREAFADVYQCPGSDCPISRAVHLARLAAYDPACRTCPRRGETAGLSDRRLRRIEEVESRPAARPLITSAGFEGVWLSEFGPAECQQAGRAFGIDLRRLGHGIEGDSPIFADAIIGPVPCDASGTVPLGTSAGSSRVLLAGNGAAHAPEALAALSQGLRWAGCDVVELEPVTAGAIAWAVGRLDADGGVLVGTPGHRAHVAGLTFWRRGAAGPLAGESLDALARLYHAALDRPRRTYGAHGRASVAEDYLAGFAGHYHALRPLAILLDTPCGPLADYLQTLTATSACAIRRDPIDVEIGPGAAGGDRFHFAARIDGNGFACRVWDERGAAVDVDRLARVIANERPRPALPATGTPDALVTLTNLLALLSRRDRPLSEWMDVAG
ncbi:MAG: hypothetical protein JW809_05870 [Pirellulales bacterium]|nr:hypothetical protein [Pirellulales bacterium]